MSFWIFVSFKNLPLSYLRLIFHPSIYWRYNNTFNEVLQADESRVIKELEKIIRIAQLMLPYVREMALDQLTKKAEPAC